MDGPEDHRHHEPHEMPVQYIDDRRFYRGYGLLAVSADQRDALHRRMVADINNEYSASIFAKKRAKFWAVGYAVASLGMAAVDVVVHFTH